MATRISGLLLCVAGSFVVSTVHGNGSLSGYRWGVERKRALLERETQTAMKNCSKKQKIFLAP